MKIELIITIITVIFNTLLGIIVMIRNPKNETNRLLGFYALCMSIYAIINYYSTIPSDPEEWLFKARLAISMGAFVISPFFLLGYTFPEEKSQIKPIWRILLWIIIGSIAAISTTPLVFKVLEILPDGSPNAILGPAFPLYAIDTIIIPIVVFILTIIKYKKTKGHKRTQMKYFMGAIFLNVILTDIVGFILPNFFKNTHYLFLAPAISVLFIGIVFYLITKHKLLDIKILILRSLSYLILLGLVSLVYIYGLIYAVKLFVPDIKITGPLYWILFIVLFGISISSHSIYKFIERNISKYFFKSMYRSEDVVIESFKILASDITFDNSALKLFDLIRNKINTTKIGVLMVDQHKISESKDLGFNFQNIQENKDIQKLENIFHKESESQSILFEDTMDESLKNLFRNLDIDLVFPLKSEDGEVALFLIGPKASGDMYTDQDYAVLKIIGDQISQTIINTNKFKKLQIIESIKSDFVTSVSHEFRTPLTESRWKIEMLLDNKGSESSLSDKDRAQITDVYFSLKWLNESLNQINLAFDIETGKMHLNKELVNIHNFIDEEIKNQINETAKIKDIEVKINISQDIPDINIDKKFIKETLMVILDNAIKYSNKNSFIDMIVDKIGEEKDNEFLQIKIKDNGTGIPEKDMSNVFAKFYRGEKARKEVPNGLGLGLFNAKEIVEAHNGKIRAESEEGKGTTFVVELPYN